MKQLTTSQTVVAWVLQCVAAGILLQTLFFKFSGAEESVYIFTAVGQFLGIPAMEPWGRIGSGVAELVAALLLLVPAAAPVGAALAMGLMGGAIGSHVAILGVEVMGDGGLLFGLALIVFCASAAIIVMRRSQLPAVARLLQLA